MRRGTDLHLNKSSPNERWSIGKTNKNITNKQKKPTKQTVGQTWRYYIVNDSCLQAGNVHSNVQCFACMTYAKETGKNPCIKTPWRFNFNLTSVVMPLPNERQTSLTPSGATNPHLPHCLGSVLKGKIKGEYWTRVWKKTNLIPSWGQASTVVGPRKNIIFF